MRILSICVGQPRTVEWQGRSVETSIFKLPVTGTVTARRLNLDGDRQSDLTVHGGAAKAVYAYPSEHYPYWRGELPDADLAFGAFGENFTTEGLLESELRVGDRLRVGSAEFAVTQPRMPCYKLALRFGRLDMVRRFHKSGRSGFYLAVVREGELTAGDEVTLVRGEDDDEAETIADVAASY
jgi:MOSC domain-containing protein YiiM